MPLVRSGTGVRGAVAASQTTKKTFGSNDGARRRGGGGHMDPPNTLPVKGVGVGNGWLLLDCSEISGDWAFRLNCFLSILVRKFSAV